MKELLDCRDVAVSTSSWVCILSDHGVVFERLASLVATESPSMFLVSGEDEAGMSRASIVIIDAATVQKPLVTMLTNTANRAPNARLILIAEGHEVAPDRHSLQRRGLYGWMQQKEVSACLTRILRAVEAGVVCVKADPLPTPAYADALKRLSPGRESELYEMLCLGLRNREIAQRFGNSESTVKTDASRLFRKLGVSGRRELAFDRIALDSIRKQSV
jgi:DNA-binding NarL/FixJ family response regulator